MERLTAPALQQHHALAAVEHIHRTGRHTINPVIIAAECVKPADQPGAQPVAQNVSVVSNLHARFELHLFVREQGNRHIQVNHLDAEQVAGIAQVAFAGHRIPQDISPALGPDVHGRA